MRLLEGMNDEENHCNADARVSNIKGWPWVREGDMQIEQQKINHVAVHATIRQIPHYTRQEQSNGNIAEEIGVAPPK